MEKLKSPLKRPYKVNFLDFKELSQNNHYYTGKTSVTFTSNSHRSPTLPELSTTFMNHSLLKTKNFKPQMTSPTRDKSLEISISNESRLDLEALKKNFDVIVRVPKTARPVNPDKRESREKRMVFLETIANLKTILQKCEPKNDEYPKTGKSDVKEIFKFFKLLEKLDDNLSYVMDLIINALKKVIYVNPKVIENSLIEKLSNGDEDLKLLKNINDKNSENGVRKREENTRVEMYERMLSEKQRNIDDLKQKLNASVSMSKYQEALDQVTKANNDNGSLYNEYQILQGRCQDLAEEYLDLKVQLEEEVASKEKLITAVKFSENEKQKFKEDNGNLTVKLGDLQNHVRNFKSTLEKTLIRLESVKGEVLDLRKKNKEIELENSRLHIRAGTGFEALTPRPDYVQIQESKQVDLKILDSFGKKQMISTSDVVINLINKLRFLQEKLYSTQEAPKEGSRRQSRISKLNIVKSSSDKNETTMPNYLKSDFLSINTNLPEKINRSRKSSLRPSLRLNLSTNSNRSSIKGDGERPVSTSRKSNMSSARSSYVFAEDKSRNSVRKSELHSSDEESPSGSPSPQIKKSAFANIKIKIQLSQEEKEDSNFGNDIITKTDALMTVVQDAVKCAKDIEDVHSS